MKQSKLKLCNALITEVT